MWRGRPSPRLWECITVLKECLANRKRLRRPNLFHGPINYGLQFPRVLHLTPFGENFPRFVGRVPGGISHLFFGVNCLLHFSRKGFFKEFCPTWVPPENSFGGILNMKGRSLIIPPTSSPFKTFRFPALPFGILGARSPL